MVLLGCFSAPGTRYGSLNQDFVLIEELHSKEHMHASNLPQCYCVLVLDGHGMLGEECSKEAAYAILKSLRNSDIRKKSLIDLHPDEVEEILVNAFNAGHHASLQSYNQPPSTYTYPLDAPEERKYTLTRYSGQTVYSNPIVGPRLLEFGTTATCCLLQGRMLVVAHAGDSLVVMGKQCGGNRYRGEFITEKHCGKHEGERARLERNIGKKVRIRKDDGYISISYPGGPTGAFSLSMTRALGHKMMSYYGVIPTPTVSIFAVNPEDVCIIAASDGVWEGLDADRAVQEVTKGIHYGANYAAYILCKKAMEVVAHGRSRPDNTTAAVIVFEEAMSMDEDIDDMGGNKRSNDSKVRCKNDEAAMKLR